MGEGPALTVGQNAAGRVGRRRGAQDGVSKLVGRGLNEVVVGPAAAKRNRLPAGPAGRAWLALKRTPAVRHAPPPCERAGCDSPTARVDAFLSRPLYTQCAGSLWPPATALTQVAAAHQYSQPLASFQFSLKKPLL